MQAQEASRGLAHAALRSALRHAFGLRCARALEHWRSIACAPRASMAAPPHGGGSPRGKSSGLGSPRSSRARDRELRAALADADADATSARLELSVVRRELQSERHARAAPPGPTPSHA